MAAIAFRTLVLFRHGEYRDADVPVLRGLGRHPEAGTSLEEGGGGGDAGPDPRLEVPAHTHGDGVRAAVGLEALEVEPHPLDPLPEMRVVDVAAIRVERVDHLEEGALQAGGLGGGMERR
jgi:hypothetical protein